MEQPFSTSKVTVEYSDPHDVYRLLAPGLIPRLPLRHLHWQSHAGPLRSIDTLHVELTAAQSDPFSVTSPAVTPGAQPRSGSVSGSASGRDDGFQTASIGGRAASTETVGSNPALATKAAVGKEQRHQIPGLRRTPYLKVLLVRCDDNDSYKSQVRGEIREWIKSNTSSVSALKKSGAAANHDSFELMIIHVVIPNTVAATQPRISGKAPDGSSNPDLTKTSSRWGKSSSTLLEKLRADFNSSGKVSVDRVAQIRIGVNDVPYDMLPRVVPAVPTGYSENEKDAENAWTELIDKMKDLILSSFDKRVGQYEEDIREKDTQRSLPGWNFCTFFILKEGLARGFESVGLVEDALVGYDELSVGLDTIIQEQTVAGSATTHGGSLLNYTDDLKKMAQKAVASIVHGNIEYEGDEETVDLQSKDKLSTDYVEDIPISSTKKQYREMILANNVSVFDFRCYIFSRQIALLLRLGNAWSSREELLAKLKEQQESVLCGVASNVPLPKATDETENLSMLAEICRRTLEFIPALSQVMRQDILAAIADKDFHTAELGPDVPTEAALAEVVDNIVTSYAFSIAQQVLAQTSTKALPIPPSTLASPKDAHEPKASIPEPKTMMHPARSSSLNVRPGSRPPPSPGVFPGGTGRRNSVPGPEKTSSHFLKAGLEDLAARRAELYALSRNILEECGKKRGWSDGWVSVPIVGETGVEEMDEINLDDEVAAASELKETMPTPRDAFHTVAGFDNRLLRTALDNKEDFYRLYETLTDKALRHYNVAGHIHSVNANMADLAVLKYHLGDYSGARECFYQSTPFFGESGWTLLELSMLVMYSKCLQRLQRKPDFVRAALKLLTKAAMAERERINDKTALRIGRTVRPTYPDKDAIRGVLDELIEASKELPEDEYIPLTTLFTNIDIEGAPVYQDRQDSFSITLQLHSLLVDELGVDHAKVRLVGHAGNATREVWVESTSPLKLSPGKNKIQLHSNVIVPGIYEVAQVRLSSGKLCLVHDRDTTQTATLSPSHVLRHPRITLYQRSGAFDVRMSSARHMQLDKNNCLDLELLSGWNEVTNCELRVKPATGGLRLLTSETKVVKNGEGKPLKPTEGSLFNFKSLPAGTSVKIQFPFTTDQDVVSVSVRVDVTYSTEHGSFTFSKTPSVNVGLALGVNVQDVFKHAALFERFTVSTATASPLRLYRSELLDSDIFESHFGTAPDRPITIFPKQPAGLLYKVTRRHDQIKSKAKKTMYLKLYYSVVQEELSSLVEKSLSEELSSDTPLSDLSRLLTSTVVQHIQKGWSGDDLERVTLLGEFSTAFLANVHWERYFTGLGCSPLDGSDLSQAAADFIREWQRKHPKLTLLETDPDESELQTILIPVDIPSLTIVHTADIRLQEGVPSLLDGTNTDLLEPETVCVNQLIPATLHLKWTRIWDTGSSETGVVLPPNSTDLEFSYEVSAPADTWLLSGRRKGHFVIPAPQNAEGGEGMSSTPDTEADIPLLLIPLREGYLPYPTVDIREVHSSGGGLDEHTFAHASDTDHRNLGETVRVVADRARVTVSLDASGPGGGPLVLESEGRGLEGRIVV